MVTVVPATYEHLPALQLSFQRLLAERAETYPVVDAEEMQRFTLLMAARVDEGHQAACVFVAEADGSRTLLGFVACQIGTRPIGKPHQFCFMDWIGVAEKARKLGIGRLLVEAACAWAEARGCTVIEGNVSPGPDATWATGASDYARRQVITITEARASVLVPVEARPPVGASAAPSPAPPMPAGPRKKRAKARKPVANGHAPEALP